MPKINCDLLKRFEFLSYLNKLCLMKISVNKK